MAHVAVPRNDLENAVEAQIEMINLGGPNAVIECKQLVRKIEKLSVHDGFIETGPWSQRMFSSDEGAEGMAAFRDKRKPAWVQKE